MKAVLDSNVLLVALVTNDSHFNEVEKIPFPKVNIISADKFLDVIQKI